MAYQTLIRIPAKDAAGALLASRLLLGHAARDHAETIARDRICGPGNLRDALCAPEAGTAAAIGEAIAFSGNDLDLFVDPMGIASATARLAAHHEALEATALAVRLETKAALAGGKAAPGDAHRAMEALDRAEGARDRACIALAIALGAQLLVEMEPGLVRPMRKGARAA